MNNPIISDDQSGYLRQTAFEGIGGSISGELVESVAEGGLKEGLKGLWYATIGTIGVIGTAIASISADNSDENRNNTEKLYRAMDYVEYNRLEKYGRFSSSAKDKPWVMDTKWFATNAVDADTWGSRLNPNGYKIVEVTVPREALNGMYYNQFLDGIGPAYNATVPYINSVMIGFRTVI